LTNQSNQTFANKLNGILLPIPTPFDAAENFAVELFRSNIARWNKSGIAGYAVLGSTGERVHMDEREYVQVIEAAREATPRDLAFIAGAGQHSTLATINEIKLAKAAGAEAALVLTPYFYRTAITQAALVGHYRAVADASSLPIILYSMPALTGIKIEPETVAELSVHDNIIGIKDSSAEIEKLAKTVELVAQRGSQNFTILTGNGTVLFEALKAGAVGGILAVGCVAPALSIEIFNAVRAGKAEEGRSLQEKLTPLAQAVTTKYGIGGLKAALDFIGYEGGSVRAPLRSPSEAARAEILDLLQRAGAIAAEEARA
jgi:4-hydroxy-2-oxoglutarate aldolase